MSRTRRPVSLRTRISVVLVGAVAVTLVGANLVVFGFASRGLDQRVDDQLTGLSQFAQGLALASDRFPPPQGLPDGFPQGAAGPDANPDIDGYIAVIDPGGQRLSSVFLFDDGAGRTPPAVPDDLEVDPGHPVVFDVAAARGDHGTERYRVRVVAKDDGTLIVAALPITDLVADRRTLVVVQVATSLVVLGLLAVLARWLVGLALRPLSLMETAAERIADGDLTQRVEPAGPETEVTRLGAALNAMLTRIEEAFATRAESEARLRRFATDASHELRTPLTSIRGYAQLLRRGRAGDEAGQALAAERIEQESLRLGRLVDDLLLLAQLDEGRPLRTEAVELDRLAGDAVDLGRMAAPERDVVFRSDGPLTVSGDPEALTRVVTNLVANALTHTPPSSAIEVRVAQRGSVDTPGPAREAVVEVVDHGPGIDPTDRPHVFERFYRADASRARSSGGSGLGLAIVDGIVAAHEGRCELDDTPGGGATFRVLLPGRADHRSPHGGRPPADG